LTYSTPNPYYIMKKKTLSLFAVALVLLIWGCMKEVSSPIETLSSTRNSSASVSKSQVYSLKNNDAQTLNLLQKEDDFKTIVIFNKKFLNKIINSKINISNTALMLSENLLDSIGWDRHDFKVERLLVKQAAQRLIVKYGIQSSDCSVCTPNNTLSAKLANTQKTLYGFRRYPGEITYLNRLFDRWNGNKASFTVLGTNTSNLRVMDDSGGESGGGTQCAYGGYISCLIICGATIEFGPVAGLCAVGCYCGFCSGPSRDIICYQSH